MKSFTNKFVSLSLLCVVFCFGWSTQKNVVPVPKPIVEELRKQAEVCSKETGVPAETLKKVIDWTIPNELPSKKFLLCITKNTGFTDETGHLNEDKVGALKPEDGSQEEFVETIKNCNKVTKEDVFESVFEKGECITKNYVFKALN